MSHWSLFEIIPIGHQDHHVLEHPFSLYEYISGRGRPTTFRFGREVRHHFPSHTCENRPDWTSGSPCPGTSFSVKWEYLGTAWTYVIQISLGDPGPGTKIQLLKSFKLDVRINESWNILFFYIRISRNWDNLHNSNWRYAIAQVFVSAVPKKGKSTHSCPAGTQSCPAGTSLLVNFLQTGSFYNTKTLPVPNISSEFALPW